MVWQDNSDRLFIGGEWVAPSGTRWIDVVNPHTEQAFARVPEGERADIDRAVAAARDAFDDGPWPWMSLVERIAVLERLGVLIAERRDEIARLVTDEMGCPITLSLGMQATTPRLLVDSFVAMAPEYPWETLRESATGRALVVREPAGVVAAVIPWNNPMVIALIKLVPALLAGCTAVLKPAPETPLDSFLLAELFAEAGLPAGVVNVVPADREVSEYLVTHPGVDKVTFTGSTAAGRRVAEVAGPLMKRVTLELGGKSAAIVLDDADFGPVVESLRIGSFRNSGQVCSLKSRVLVPRSRHEEFLDAFTAMVDTMPVGDPTDPATQVGPLVNSRQHGRVLGYIDAGRSEGARLVRGGGRPSGLERGLYVEPTVFTDVAPGMRIAQEEIFGPVATVIPYDDEAQAIAFANDSQYGLNGSVFTSDPAHGVRIARRIRTGTVEINGSPVGFTAPIGGFKSSGIGREAGLEGFDAYVELKSIGLPRDLDIVE
ncbi:aldehyde dehydrogenase [Microbacterium sp. No. 7]|uniref:aldehyde dehydrogenase n=1 Tax=Microbacterium sp. No. 7 TaxID=1714373 RepID=UPI0006D08803|nr:aldehyde dehydrogenase [Microbacterium sp. No. 7]ALJ21623.1 aldehyde dehydrogenase [Microbacterium sp. No. 7]